MTRSTSTVLIAVFMVLTFPIWIGLAGGLLGLAAGLFGACIGIIAGIFGIIGGIIGAIVGGIAWLIDGIFGWGFHPFHIPRFFMLIAVVLLVLYLVRRDKPKAA